jgi:Flp pilus assembly protein CpaB
MSITAPRRRKYVRRDLRALLSTRKGAAAAGLVCVVVAGAVVLAAMSSYRKTVNAGVAPQTVFVASQLIAKNTPASVIAQGDLFKPVQVHADKVAAGAIADMSTIHGKVAAKDIYPGEQLTAADFTASGSLPAQLAPSERAVTLSLDEAHGMVGTIETGDHVDVYAGLQLQSSAGQNTPVLRLLMADVPVLKGPPQPNSAIGGAQTTTTSLVTLGVNTDQAGAITFAADAGKLWLVLRPAHASTTAPPSMVTVQSLLFGTKGLPTGGH